MASVGEPLPILEVYRSLIGKLNFLTHTRPDLSFAVQHLSQFMQKPCVPHMKSALHLLRYLNGTSDLGIFLNNSSDFSIQVYCDSDWGSCPDSRRSVTGFYILLGGSLVCWKSKKQPVVSLSSAEAGYRSLSKVVTEVTWLTRLLADFGLTVISSNHVYCDNQAAIHIGKNHVFHERTKHIELDCHFVRTKLADSLVTLLHTSSSTLMADVFTKSLPGAAHHSHLSKLGVLSHSNLKGVFG
ncbi:secreted RxLR effector protein 161-like [Nicotiana tabacum]|uniref:Secreted RxLR effector protein 161-like n=1 Tax=Nicotiana tabacum TaxID=4097 RepID=A0AC58ST30_TOBAC